jgi:hypothetical protein
MSRREGGHTEEAREMRHRRIDYTSQTGAYLKLLVQRYQR